MSFNYDKHKNHQDDGHFWTSYSDLFLGLSTIFLLLYVTSSLKTNVSGVNQEQQAKEIQTLKAKIDIYESQAKQSMKAEASKSEMDRYTELMDKLTLLKEEAKDEKERLRQAADDNQKKEHALNQYQEMVKSIINANVLAKSKITRRDTIIDEQDDTIVSQEEQIASLNEDVDRKKKLIADNENKIAKAQEQLDDKMAQLKDALRNKEISKKSYESKLAQLQNDNQSRIDKLNEQISESESDLKQSQARLGQLSNDLAKTKNELDTKSMEVGDLKSKLGGIQGEYEKKMEDMKGQHESEKARDRAKLEGELKSAKMGAAEKAKRLADFEASAKAKEKELGDKLAGMARDLGTKEKELKKAMEERDLRKDVANEIKKGFQKAGVKADIDLQTGEVMLDFGDAYFETDSAKLNGDMKSILEKAMPVYAKSLFGNDKVKDKISAVEIVGFASPTYGGKFVDPTSSKTKDKEALKYNMDLSYKRAKSIFSHILDDKTMEFDHQKDMYPVMKVSGRSFLEVMKVKDVKPGTDFCKVNDCKKSQRVVIRFSMDGKK